MARNYLIAIGGTGSRCLEAVIYLTAVGIFKNPLHVLIIDPDQSNGNSVKARTLVTQYHDLHLARQPQNAELRGWFGGTKLLPPQLFQPSINLKGATSTEQHGIFWHNPNPAQRRFGEVIQYQAQDEKLKNFINLFYEPTDLEMVLDVGYRGRTNVGAVALKQDLEGSSSVRDYGLREFLENLNIDLQAGEARVFVMGSVFGGTGAAGMPTIPKLIANLPGEVISADNRSRLRYGCAMMTPYFSFPKGVSSSSGPATDSARHAIATQAALLHYAHVPPGYQHVYFIGAPARPQTNTANVVGGQNQANAPHYAELIAALAAWQFFALEKVPATDQQLHFADSMRGKTDVGVSWETLPVDARHAASREEFKRRLTIFATMAFFYKNFLYERFLQGEEYVTTNWYKDNFAGLNLDQEKGLLEQLFKFSKSFLDWLAAMGETGQKTETRLFNWDALTESDPALADKVVGNLLNDPMSGSAKRATAGFDGIYSKLDSLKLKGGAANSAAGLFIYMLHHAVSQFCHENYAWRA